MTKKDEFIAEIIEVCKKHHMVLADSYGDMIVADINDADIEYLNAASDDTEETIKQNKIELEAVRQELRKQSPYKPDDGVFYS